MVLVIIIIITTINSYIDTHPSMNYSPKRPADMLGQSCSEVVCIEIISFFQEAGLEGRSGGLIN